MPRGLTGTYTLPLPAFVAGTTILSASVNTDLDDIATALTQSLATTGVSTMTGPIKAAAGTVTAPSYTFGSATGTGFYLSAADAISWTAAGVLAATFNADGTTTWVGAATFSSTIAAATGSTVGGNPITNFPSTTVGIFGQTSAPTGWTKNTSAGNDSALRVVTGTVSSGGTVDFSTLFARTATDSHTLAESEIPAHTHSYNRLAASGGGSVASGSAIISNDPTTTGSTGGGGGHTHNIDMRVKYVDVIRATKD